MESGRSIGGGNEDLADLYDQGRISPYVGSTFLLDEADAAHHFIQDRKNLGKVILLVD